MVRILCILCMLLLMSGLSLAQDDERAYKDVLKVIEKAEQSGTTKIEFFSSTTTELKELPPEIGNLINLEELIILQNQLTTLPPEIGNLHQLKRLRIVSGQLSTLPPEIGNLTNLTELHLGKNQLTNLPPEIGNLTQLRILSVGKNQLTNLPPEIGNLTQLRRLLVWENQLTSLPPEIENLSNLRMLNLEHNQLKHLPTELGQLLAEKYCCVLRINGNPLISPPLEVIAQGTPAVLEYLRNEAWWHLQRLIISGATGFGLLAVLILGVRWRMRRMYRKSKRKNAVV